jgi:tRNA(Ile)-lysidine synthase
MSKIERAMKDAWSRLIPGSAVFCAVSGGLDSMVMLEAAAQFRRKNDPSRRLVVLHVNHNLRGAESEGDEAFVRAAAARLGLAIEVLRIEWGSEKPSQAACRRRREEFFRSTLSEGDRLFLAHHLDDQAETLLLRMIRGTGLRGLAGMRPEAGAKLRPLLGISRAEIEAHARAEGISWREDSSNRSTKYERNWLRHEILPLLEARRPGVAAKLSALAAEAASLEMPPAGFSSFELGEDWAFYRGDELKRASSGDISNALRLSRMHTRGLSGLLAKGSGRYEAEGVGFRLSAGILLAERKPFAQSSEWVESPGLVAVSNSLGRWEVRIASGEKVGSSSSLSLGEKAKKEFQRHRVPVFFRELVPLLVRSGKPRALLPLASETAEVELHGLGRWWWNGKST